MNKTEKEIIIRLRTQGVGYSEIAKRLDLPRETVKSFCVRNKVYVYIPGDRCKNCGEKLIQKEKRKRKLFCSKECRLNWWHSHPESLNRKAIYNYTCACCGKVFSVYGNNHRKYCSHQCYINDRFGGDNDDSKGV